jgi:hypothetical protein
MSIRENIITLLNIQQEISSLSADLRKLRTAAKKEEISIMKYMADTGKTGFKFNGSTVTLKQKQCRTRKRKAEKEGEILKVLQRYGVNSSVSQKTIMSELNSALRGTPVQSQALLLKKP